MYPVLAVSFTAFFDRFKRRAAYASLEEFAALMPRDFIGYILAQRQRDLHEFRFDIQSHSFERGEFVGSGISHYTIYTHPSGGVKFENPYSFKIRINADTLQMACEQPEKITCLDTELRNIRGSISGTLRVVSLTAQSSDGDEFVIRLIDT